MSEKRRSMADADRAAEKRWAIGATIIVVLIGLLCYNVIPSFFGEWHNNATSWTKHFAFIPLGVALFMNYKAGSATMGEKTGGNYWILVLLLIALGIAVSSGFVFDLK